MMNESELNQRRLESNRKLLQILSEKIEAYPSQRFSQMLLNYGFVSQVEIGDQLYWRDEFNKEPWELLERCETTL